MYPRYNKRGRVVSIQKNDHDACRRSGGRGRHCGPAASGARRCRERACGRQTRVRTIRPRPRAAHPDSATGHGRHADRGSGGRDRLGHEDALRGAGGRALRILYVPPGAEGAKVHYHEWAYNLAGDFTNNESTMPDEIPKKAAVSPLRGCVADPNT